MSAVVQLHKYKTMHVWMKPGVALTFSDGERIIAVLSSAEALGYKDGTLELIVLVELPEVAD